MKIDISKLTARMGEALDENGFMACYFFHNVEMATRVCESPIEAMLAAALLFTDRLTPNLSPLILALHCEINDYGDKARLLIPQFKLNDYRIDFAYLEQDVLVCIECDGHDFHERTKLQAARDKQRDRNIQAAGYPILRFTGSEIWNDPFYCATQIHDFVSERHVPAEFRK